MPLLRRVTVVSPDPAWPESYRREAETIAGVLGEEIVSIHHMGSTSIPGMRAKPIVDILVEVRDIEKIDGYNDEMLRIGYQPEGEFGIAGRRFFTKGGDELRTHNIHTFQSGHPEIEQCLNFRDYLSAHDKEAQAYCQLKVGLAKEYPEDIQSYNQGKNAFIKDVIARARLWKAAQIAKDGR